MKTAARLLGLLSFSLLFLAGCHELGHMDGLGDYGSSSGDLAGEVRYVDTRNREIEVRSDAGRTYTVRYDNRTRVTYRQREYSPSNLETGDFIAMRTTTDSQGKLYTDNITVRESVQDRGTGGTAGRFNRLEGTVEYVDARRGTFEVRDRSNRLVVVSIPFNAPRTVADRFNRLREGDYVRIEGKFISQDRFELEAFV